ncbi:Hypothetical protein CINCED_3A019353 [Cinara cedri]|uniref:Uncharacterized protein n=1 Tax=Cinara cedri TaxID=506608 RepID=A0A5E4MSU1_9HEMI|nr:Hypothetical protein CINCED_3A019353 [Cinara cedri]
MNHKHIDCKDSSSATMQARLHYLDEQIQILKENVAKHERTKEELMDLENQLLSIQETIEIKCENEKQSFENINQKLNSVSSKYEQAQYAIDKLNKENHNLECKIHSNYVKELEIDHKIKNLECIKKQIMEHNNKLFDKLHKEQECAKSLCREQSNLENLAKQRTEEARKLHCKLTEAEAAVECTRKKLCKLKQWHDEREQSLREMSSRYQEMETQQEIVKESGAEKLANADWSAEMASRELADATAEVTDRKAERERTAMTYRELKATCDAETCRLQLELKELSDQHDQLTCKVTDVSTKLAEKCDTGQRLKADANAENERLAELSTEVEKLNRQACFERSVLALYWIKTETEVATLRELMVVKCHKLQLVENEVEDLKRAWDRRESGTRKVIKEAELCSTGEKKIKELKENGCQAC